MLFLAPISDGISVTGVGGDEFLFVTYLIKPAVMEKSASLQLNMHTVISWLDVLEYGHMSSTLRNGLPLNYLNFDIVL